MIHCRAWSSCNTNVLRDGCTFYDVFPQVLRYPRWSRFKSYDVTQQRYIEVIDAVRHLCTSIQPGRLQVVGILSLLLRETSCQLKIRFRVFFVSRFAFSCFIGSQYKWWWYTYTYTDWLMYREIARLIALRLINIRLTQPHVVLRVLLLFVAAYDVYQPCYRSTLQCHSSALYPHLTSFQSCR